MRANPVVRYVALGALAALAACEPEPRGFIPRRGAAPTPLPGRYEPDLQPACSLDGDGLSDAGADAADTGAPEPPLPTPSPPLCQNGKVVHFVYFVEADRVVSECQRRDIERQAYAFQQFWFDQLGVTFYLNDPVVDVVRGAHEASYYPLTPDGVQMDPHWYRVGNIEREVYRQLGISDTDPDHRVVNYPTTRYDGRVGGDYNGVWMDGDDLTCLADGGFTHPYDDEGTASCMGHVAHEFGHVLGLDHTGPEDDCMMYGFYTDNPAELCSFSPRNVAQILADPDNEGWFEAMPGERCTGR